MGDAAKSVRENSFGAMTSMEYAHGHQYRSIDQGCSRLI